uniref:Dynein_heavy domain-containing protein n=1 Tax=Heterorhabditis bacteriophora TaxID=37862 RepID=A0A1I7XQB4_HETBA
MRIHIRGAVKLPGFENMNSDPAGIQQWLLIDNPEASVPILWEDPEKKLSSCLIYLFIIFFTSNFICPLRIYLDKLISAPIGIALCELVVVHSLRADRLMASAHRLVSAAFSDGFMQQDKVIDLREIIDNEISSSDPVLLCSATGYDASGKIEDLGIETGRQVTSIAIGSAEGFNQADLALTAASKSGRWVLLKNVHLAPQWLGQMEKRLHTLKPHANFRLFLTAEIHPKRLRFIIIDTNDCYVFYISTFHQYLIYINVYYSSQLFAISILRIITFFITMEYFI